MDIREKLVELIRCADYHPCRGAVRTIGSMFTTEFIEDIASHLIAHGVTVGKPLTEYLHPVDNYAGLKGKYLVFKADTGEQVTDCFVLRPAKDHAAVEALRAYAYATDNKTLSNDIYNLVGDGGTVRKWIPVTERMPEPETEVLILAEHKTYSFKGTVTMRHIMTTGMYEDGSINTEDSEWHWETDGFEYDEELDAHIIPEGWWEYKHYNGDDEYNHPIDDAVTHWMPLPEPPKEGTT